MRESVERACACGEETEEQKLARVAAIVDEFKPRAGNLIQILHLAQGAYGYLPLDLQRFIADRLDVPWAEVTAVSSFYSFFSTRPRGLHTVRVCLGTACYVRGSTKILRRLEETFGVAAGETTRDRLCTLEVVRCMGACGLAPAVMVDQSVVRQVNPDRLQRVLELLH